MQICISPQTDNRASIPPLSFYRPDALPATQPTGQSTEGVIKPMFTESEIVPNGCDAGATFINIYHKYSHNYTHLMAFFQVSRHQKGRTIMDVK